MAVTLYFVRHGRSESNNNDYFYDDSDEPLITEGRMQAWEAGHTLKELGIKFDGIYCSPYRRARETCQIALHEMGMAGRHVRFDERLEERKFNGLFDKTISREHYRELYDYNVDRSIQYGVESLEQLEYRATWFLSDMKMRHQNGTIVAFSHGVIGLAFRAVVCGRPESGSLYDFELLKNGEIMKLLVD